MDKPQDMLNQDLPEACLRFQSVWEKQLEAETISLDDEGYLATHSLSCAACQAYAQEMQQIIQTLQHLEPLPVPADLTDRIMARVKQPIPFRRPAAYVAIAASLLALVVSTSVFSSWNQSPVEGGSKGQTLASLPKLPAVVSQKPVSFASKPLAVPAVLKPEVKSAQPLVGTPVSGSVVKVVKTSGSQSIKTAKPVTTQASRPTPGVVAPKPIAIDKELIAMGSPDEAFFPSDIDEATQADTQSDLLAQWVPLEGSLEYEEGDTVDFLGSSSQDDEDPMSDLVGF